MFGEPRIDRRDQVGFDHDVILVTSAENGTVSL